MFSRVPNASKVAAAALVRHVARWKFPFIDCQLHNAHLASLGAREVPRSTFLDMLQRNVVKESRRGAWVFEGW